MTLGPMRVLRLGKIKDQSISLIVPPTLEKARQWARKDLNLEPTDYESAALTVELRARG
jgi:hypothetical protein